MNQDPNQANNQGHGQWPEYAKIGLLLVIFIWAIILIALGGPFLIERVVPYVLGLDSTQEPSVVPEFAPETDVQQPADGQGGEPSVDSTSDGDQLLRHTVKEGETLHEIAVNYDITVEDIASANNIINPNQLQPGTVLIIPRPDSQ